MQTRYFKDRIIAYKKNDSYIAVSLDFDLLAEGNNIKEALERLHDATKGYLKMCCKDNEPDKEVYRSAPKKYQAMYELFIELSAKQRKSEEDKLKERRLLRRETQATLRSYPLESLCHA